MDTEPAQRPDDPAGADESDLPHFEETILATTRYLAAIEDLTDDDVRAPSLLPGWTRGHVITHISRNADALARVLRAAQAGTEATMRASSMSPRPRAPTWSCRPPRPSCTSTMTTRRGFRPPRRA